MSGAGTGTSAGRRRAGPLPWHSPVPLALTVDPLWGSYLRGRAGQVRDLARQIADQARGWDHGSAPTWAAPLLPAAGPDEPELLGRLAVWRAAHDVSNADLRPTGPPATDRIAAGVQSALDDAVQQRLGAQASSAVRWRDFAATLAPQVRDDPAGGRLAERLAGAEHATPALTDLLRRCVQQQPLPEEMPAAALWWRLNRHLPADTQKPVSASQPPAPVRAAPDGPAATHSQTAMHWRPFVDSIDPRLTADAGWPALAAALQRAQEVGYRVHQQLPGLAEQPPLPDQHPARTLHTRLAGQCPAALTPMPPQLQAADERERTCAAVMRRTDQAAAPDNRRADSAAPAGAQTRTGPGHPVDAPTPGRDPRLSVARPGPSRAR